MVYFWMYLVVISGYNYSPGGWMVSGDGRVGGGDISYVGEVVG